MIVCPANCSFVNGTNLVRLTRELRDTYPPQIQSALVVLDKWFEETKNPGPGVVSPEILDAYRKLATSLIPGHEGQLRGALLCPVAEWEELGLFSSGVSVPEELLLQDDWKIFLDWWKGIQTRKDAISFSDMSPEIQAAYRRIMENPIPGKDFVFGKDCRTMKVISGQIGL